MNSKGLGKQQGVDNTKLSWFSCAVYALPCSSTVLFMAPMFILQGVYAKYYGLSLTSIAAVTLVARLFDAITDPLVGYFSDRYQARTVSRKPFILVGAGLLMMSGWFLYVPPEHLTIGYFAVWSLLFYFGWTLFEIPHQSWASELAGDTAGKTKIFSFRVVTGYLGLTLFYTVPLLPFFDTKDITPEILRWSVTIAIILMMPTLYACIRYVPNGHQAAEGCKAKSAGKTRFIIIQEFMNNRPFLLFLASYIFYGLGLGLWQGLIFIYVDSYLDLGAQFAQMLLISMVFGIVVAPVWSYLAALFGKKNVWMVAMFLMMLSCLYTGALKPEDTAMHELILLKLINTTGVVCIGIMAPSTMSDIVDYSTWKFGANRTGTYFSVKAFMVKFLFAGGGALGLAIAGWSGFDPTLVSQSSSGVLGMKVAISYLPALLIFMSLVFVYLLPITARRHALIRRRIDSLEMRAA